MKDSTSKFQKIYMLCIILLPVLAEYNVYGGLIDLDVIVMMLLLITATVKTQKFKSPYIKITLFFIGYTIITVCINIMFSTMYSSEISIILRSGRYCIYLFVCMIIGYNIFDYKTAMRIYRTIAYLALFYIVLQTVFFYGAGITLPNKIGASTVSAVEEVGRLRAFYSEPADMAYSILPFIACSLFGPKYTERDTRQRDAILISVAIVLTTSGQGLICLIVIWAFWLINNIVKGHLNKRVVIQVLIITIVVLVFYRIGLLNYILGRATNTDSTGAISARASGYVTLDLLNMSQSIFGTGYGNYVTLNIYGLDVPYAYVNYSSVAEYLFTTGIVGTISMFGFLIKRLFKGKAVSRILVIAVLVLALGGCPLSGKYLPLYFSFIFCNKIDKYIESE